jgi:hypothetical protein
MLELENKIPRELLIIKMRLGTHGLVLLDGLYKVSIHLVQMDLMLML